MAAPVTFGASAAFACSSGALVSAGFTGMVSQYRDPNKSDEEFIKAVGVSAITGAVGGCISAGAGVAIASQAITAGTKVGIAVAAGATTGAAAFAIPDAVDYAITEGYAGEYLQENIRDCKTKDEIFSKKNAKMFAGAVAFGALAGGVSQGLTNGLSQAASNAADEVVDDIVVNAGRYIVEKAKKALPSLTKSGVEEVGKRAMAVVEKTHDPYLSFSGALQNDPDLSFSGALKHGASRAIGDKLKLTSKLAKAAKPTKVRTGKGAKVFGDKGAKVTKPEATKPKATKPGNTKTSKVRPPRKLNGKKSRNAPTSNQLRAERAKHLRVERAKQLRVERAKQLRVERAKQLRVERAKQLRVERANQLRVERAKQLRVERAKQRRVERAKQLRNSPH